MMRHRKFNIFVAAELFFAWVLGWALGGLIYCQATDPISWIAFCFLFTTVLMLFCGALWVAWMCAC
jgi:hypothetical protein